MKGHQKEAYAKCHDLGLHPIIDPMGDDHHTDVSPSDDDKAVGDAIAYFLGGLFVDKQDDCNMLIRNSYWHKEMTSVDVWTRVARALRVHGLRITDR
jgi:hypothetical protein